MAANKIMRLKSLMPLRKRLPPLLKKLQLLQR